MSLIILKAITKLQKNIPKFKHIFVSDFPPILHHLLGDTH